MMPVLLTLMMIAFALVGLALAVNSVLEWRRVSRRKHALVRATGVIREVVKEWRASDGSQKRIGGGSRRHYRFFPVIEFQRADGEKASFKSSIGDGGVESRYRVGQQIGVLYDPEGTLEPMIDTWFALWGPALMQFVAGLAFLGGSGLIWVAFGKKIMGG